MHNLLSGNQPVIHFVYGLALFLMGWTIGMQPRSASGLRLARSLPFLAAYGTLRGLSEWGMVFVQLQREHMDPVSLFLLHRAVEVLMATSWLGLFLFGADLVRKFGRRWNLAPHVGLLLFGAWLATFAYFSGRPLTAQQQQVLITESEVWARYLLVVPGTLLAAWGLHLQTRQFEDGGFEGMLPDLRGASLSMVLYCILAGFLVPRAPFFPANLIHVELFTGMEPLVIFLRRVISVSMAFFLVRTLRVFDSEIRRRLEIAETARAAAEERERLGLELHDGILQSVYATGLGLQAVRRRLITDPEGAAQRVDLTLERLNGVIDEIRAYIRSLTAAPMTMADLQKVTSAALEEFQALYGIPCTLTVEPATGGGDVKVPAQQIMPILQESLSNAGRHSGANRVDVRLVVNGDMVTLAICDDGKGFDPQAAKDLQGHYGLQNLRRRTQTAGGRLNIRSGPGRGTLVEVQLPLQKGESSS